MYLIAFEKTLYAMARIAIILLIGTMHVCAAGYSQKVTLSLKDAPLKAVLQAIQQQSGYKFFYADSDLKLSKNISISTDHQEVEKVLQECFRDQPLTYAITDQTVVIQKKQVPSGQPAGSIALIPPPIDIHGHVADSVGLPLAGASVTVKGSKIGTETNVKGDFTLVGIKENAIIIISYTGYTTRQFKAEANNPISVVLNKSANPLDQVQVIAYGTTTQRFTAGNVASVSGADIGKQPVNNPLLALEGRVPGLFIQQANGLNGAGVIVQIQGQNSIGNGNDPLYIIDGVPYASQIPSGTGLGGQLVASNATTTVGPSPFSFINPSDIENIEILKDADATAIYGSRAANGAILVTTKKGKQGTMAVDFNLQNGWGSVTRFAKMMNTPQYLSMRHEALQNDGLAPDPSKDYDLTLWDTTRYTNWQKTLIGGTAQYTNVVGTVSGGSANTQWLVSGTYNRQTTVFPGDFSDQKSSLHFNINSTSNNRRFNIQVSGSYLVDVNHLPNVSPVESAILTEPDAPPLYNPDGSLNWALKPDGSSSWTNPISYLYTIYKNTTDNLVGNALLIYHLLPGLDIRSSFGYTNLQTNGYAAYPQVSVAPQDRPFSPSTVTYGTSFGSSWIIEPQLSYKKNIGAGKMDLLLGGTIQENNTSTSSITGRGYSSDELLPNVGAAASVTAGVSNITQYKYKAFFGRLNYIWQDKYIIDLTARRDGSSRFGPENQFHDFWSVAGAWIFTQENFFRGSHFLSFGKLRTSYGTTGNDQIGDYTFISQYYITNGNGVPYQGGSGLVPFGLSNPYLQWELTTKVMVGGDLGFLKDRILLNVTWQRNRSSNQLLYYNLPVITGFSNIPLNFPATMQNRSWEFSVTTKNMIKKTFTWNSTFNLTVPQNKLIEFPDLASSPYSYSLTVGQSLGYYKVFHALGVDPATGQYIFQTAQGAKTTSPSDPQDRTVGYSPFPKFYAGLSNTITYKSFQLDFFFQFVKQSGTDFFFYNASRFPGQFYPGFSNQAAAAVDRWQKPGDQAKIAEYSSTNGYYTALASDYAIGDASYLRLKNLSFSWQIPAEWQQSAHLKNARLYIQGQNLLTITNYKGTDPEIMGTLNYTTLPPLRMWTIGAQLTF